MVDKLQNDLKAAQLARDEIKVSTLRLLLSEIKNAQIAKNGDLSEEDLISVLQREAKKRKEAALGFRAGGREQSAQKEETELAILQNYLPEALSEALSNEELTKIVDEVINELGVSSISDMGRVMGVVMGKVTGRADGGSVSAIVKQKLS